MGLTTLPPESIRSELAGRLFGYGASASEARWAPAAGGLSEAAVWRVEHAGQAYAVRRWWRGVCPRYRAWIARTLGAVEGSGLAFVAAPLGGLGDANWPYHDAHDGCWEAAPWKPGEPLSRTPHDPEAVALAAEGLARLHARLRNAGPCPQPASDAPADRRRRLDKLLRTGATTLPRPAAAAWPAFADLLTRLPLAAGRALRRLEEIGDAAPRPAAQAIHGDARPEHFLLDGGRLLGVIDFAAMRVDTPWADVARLAGELAQGDPQRLEAVVGAYEAAADAPVDLATIGALDSAAAVLSAANWARWLSDPAAPPRDPRLVAERLESIVVRAPA